MAEKCDIGNTIGVGKVAPCKNPAKHYVHCTDSADGEPRIKLCEGHFDIVLRAGLITEPYLGYTFDKGANDG